MKLRSPGWDVQRRYSLASANHSGGSERASGKSERHLPTRTCSAGLECSQRRRETPAPPICFTIQLNTRIPITVLQTEAFVLAGLLRDAKDVSETSVGSIANEFGLGQFTFLVLGADVPG